MNEQEIQELFDTLPPWSGRSSFTPEEWKRYINTARSVQRADPGVVETAIEKFMHAAIKEEFQGYESESKLFLLMRLVFDLPEAAPASERRSFKGWINWPTADEHGNVSLAWPITWQTGGPTLVAPYEGSEGRPYAAVEEYRYLRTHYPYRELET